MPKDEIIQSVANYYSSKLREHGCTPKGVDWNNLDGQNLRFEVLSNVINIENFSINDLGCGYGELLVYLSERYKKFEYNGFDVSEPMVKAATTRFSKAQYAKFEVSDRPLNPADFGVSSGIFNVKMQHDHTSWENYIFRTLDLLNETSRKGFSFNCLSSYSDKEHMRDDLYYANPLTLFDHCKTHFAKNVALLHDYGLYEFTIVVRK